MTAREERERAITRAHQELQGGTFPRDYGVPIVLPIGGLEMVYEPPALRFLTARFAHSQVPAAMLTT